ncbi:hypothetical protein [Thalassolituus sp.]|uniref:hypothetical protein n=1 Tax=Thalassolituus sp. TaxID=2030822 RepID=UPI003517E8E3
MSQQVHQQIQQLPQEAARERAMIALSAWAPRVLEYRFRTILESYSGSSAEELRALLVSDEMVAARQAEAVALKAQGSATYQAYQQRLQTSPPVSSRVIAIEALDSAMQFSRWLVLADAAVSHATGRAPDSAHTKKEALGFLMYAYRFTSPAQLTQLTAQWQAPALQQWLAEASAALPVIRSDSAEQQDPQGRPAAPVAPE